MAACDLFTPDFAARLPLVRKHEFLGSWNFPWYKSGESGTYLCPPLSCLSSNATFGPERIVEQAWEPPSARNGR